MLSRVCFCSRYRCFSTSLWPFSTSTLFCSMTISVFYLLSAFMSCCDLAYFAFEVEHLVLESFSLLFVNQGFALMHARDAASDLLVRR